VRARVLVLPDHGGAPPLLPHACFPSTMPSAVPQ
jgi:hypothetical protein